MSAVGGRGGGAQPARARGGRMIRFLLRVAPVLRIASATVPCVIALWVGAMAPAPASAAPVDCPQREELAAQRLEDGFAPVFSDIRGRVPAFGDWVFGWTPSYRRDRELLGGAAGSAWAQLDGGGDASQLLPTVERDLRGHILSVFRAKVLDSERNDPRLAAAWATAGAGSGAVDGPPPSTDEILERLGKNIDGLLLRTGRTMLSRLVGFLVRLSTGVTTGALARSSADVIEAGAWGYVPGVVVGLGVGVATFWGVDYGIATLDDWINRADYEANILKLLDESQRGMVSVWSVRLKDAIRRQCAAALPG